MAWFKRLRSLISSTDEFLVGLLVCLWKPSPAVMYLETLMKLRVRSEHDIISFLPHDAMHKRGLCRHAVSVCLSRSCILLKRINTSSKKISPSSIHTILVFPYQTSWQYSDADPLTWEKPSIFDQYSALASITAGPSTVEVGYSTC